MKRIVLLLVVLFGIAFASCTTDADVASYNLSQDADQFRIYRRVVFYNGITDKYILMVEGYCSIKKDNIDDQLELTVKTDNGTYLKHYLGLSDNVTYFVEQLDASMISTKNYKVVFKPTTIIPNIELDMN